MNIFVINLVAPLMILHPAKTSLYIVAMSYLQGIDTTWSN